MNICKRKYVKIFIISRDIRVWIFYCSLLLCYCLNHNCENLMMSSYISKMNTIFGILVPKMLKVPNILCPKYIFKKIRGLVVPLISIQKRISGPKWRLVSQVWTRISQNIMNILKYFFLQRLAHSLLCKLGRKNMGVSDPGSSPLRFVKSWKWNLKFVKSWNQFFFRREILK